MSRATRFYLMALAISWALWAPAALGLVDDVVPWHLLGALGPALAAWLVARDQVLVALGEPRPLATLVAALAPIVLVCVLAVVMNADIDGRRFLSSVELASWPRFAYWLVCVVAFGFGEEVGWRGALMPALERRFGLGLAALAFVPLWAMWHVPLFFVTPGFRAMGAADVGGWLASLVAGSFILQRARLATGSLLGAALLHGTMDIAFNTPTPAHVAPVLGAVITVTGIGCAVMLGRAGWRRPTDTTVLAV